MRAGVDDPQLAVAEHQTRRNHLRDPVGGSQNLRLLRSDGDAVIDVIAAADAAPLPKKVVHAELPLDTIQAMWPMHLRLITRADYA